MSPNELLQEAARLGLRLERVGYDQLTFTPASRCPGYLWDAMRANRPELLRWILIRDSLVAAARCGGRTAQSRRSPEERSAFARAGARARWERWRRQREAVEKAGSKAAERKDHNGF